MQRETPIRLLLIDDHAAFRQPLGYLLDRQPDMTVVGQAGTVADARELTGEADVAILDVGLPDGSGLDLMPSFRERAPRPQVLVLTATEDPETHATAIEAGAAGVLVKWVGIDEIVAAVRRVASGESLMTRQEIAEMLRLAGRAREQRKEVRAAFSSLTSREREVLEGLAEGLSDKDLARQLGISDHTARVHVTNILGKLGVDSRLQAVVKAVRHGEVDMTVRRES
jgi:DNA-binding NarL/FixJ family response regulator